MRSILLTLLLACAGGALAAPDPHSLPAPFDTAIPAALEGGPQLADIKPRCEGCAPWRKLTFRSRKNKAPERVEQVSVAAGYRAAYAFPAMGQFANVKVERSLPGRFAEDRRLVSEALRHEYEQMLAAIAEAPATPLLAERKALAQDVGRDYLEWRTGTYRDVDYQVAVLNDIDAGMVGQVVFFDARRELIVTAYLLANKPRNFATLAEYLPLQQAFIERYVTVLAGG